MKYNVIIYHDLDGVIMSTKHEIFAESDAIAKRLTIKLEKVLGGISSKVFLLTEV